MKRIYILFCAILAVQTLSAQTPIIFRPAPGLNDSTDQGGLTGGKDAWVAEGAPTTNYKDYPGISAYPISNCNATHCVAFIQFDLSTLPALVDSAFVVFKHTAHTTYCYSGCSADFYFAAINQPWYEQTITYANQPTHDSAFYGPIPVSFPNNFGVREYNITSAYNQWKSGSVPNYGMAIYSTTVTCNNAAVYINVYSSDDTGVSNRPYLKVYPHVNTGAANVLADKLGLKVYPNPAGKQANIDFRLESAQSVKCQVSDITGRMVYSSESIFPAGASTIAVPTNDYLPGLYIYNITTNEGTVTGKLIRE